MSPSSTSRRRSWLMIGACSIPTGQISTQALHCMHAQTVSLRTPSGPITAAAKPSSAPGTGRAPPPPRRWSSAPSTPPMPADAAAWLACSRSSRITSRGESGRPVA